MIFAALIAFRIKNHPTFFCSQARTQWRKLSTMKTGLTAKNAKARSNTTFTPVVAVCKHPLPVGLRKGVTIPAGRLSCFPTP